MNFTELIDWINEYWLAVTLILGTLGVGIERSTWIKINPYSSLFEWIGKHVNKEMKNELNQLAQKVDTLKADFDSHVVDSDKKEFKRIRSKILAFAKSLRNNERHTLKEFEDIFDLYADYHNYMIKNDFENGFLDAEYAYIVDKFKECQRTNSFLDSEDE